MKNDIKSILDQMYKKNNELEEIRLMIEECQTAKKAQHLKVNASFAKPGPSALINSKTIEDLCFKLDEELKNRILVEMEKYYEESSKRCDKEIEILLRELKSL